MLILKRKIGEAIDIWAGNEKIVINVLSFSEDEVKIGIDAKENVLILRDDAKKRTKKCST